MNSSFISNRSEAKISLSPEEKLLKQRKIIEKREKKQQEKQEKLNMMVQKLEKKTKQAEENKQYLHEAKFDE